MTVAGLVFQLLFAWIFSFVFLKEFKIEDNPYLSIFVFLSILFSCLLGVIAALPFVLVFALMFCLVGFLHRKLPMIFNIIFWILIVFTVIRFVHLPIRIYLKQPLFMLYLHLAGTFAQLALLKRCWDYKEKAKEKVKATQKAIVGLQDKKDDSAEDYKYFYLYGVAKDKPVNFFSGDELLIKLYRNVIGDIPGTIINISLHPYNLINEKGATPWHITYMMMKMQQLTPLDGNDLFRVNPRLLYKDFKDIRIWSDKRLCTDENPEFTHYIPVVIPFLVKTKGEHMIKWDKEIQEGIDSVGNAQTYVDLINDLCNKSIEGEGHVFMVGFDELDIDNPSAMIDRFMQYHESFLKGKNS